VGRGYHSQCTGVVEVGTHGVDRVANQIQDDLLQLEEPSTASEADISVIALRFATGKFEHPFRVCQVRPISQCGDEPTTYSLGLLARCKDRH
jgi:hypothetical protein